MVSRYFKKKNPRGAPKQKTDAPFGEDIQQQLLKVLGDELVIAERNTEVSTKHFDEYYNMVHCLRVGKENDWESDIYLPEFVSRLLTDIGNFVAQYFSSDDYVETAKHSSEPEDVAEAKASKDLLNYVLNRKDSYYYHKLVRLLMFVRPTGYGYIKGGYAQRVENRFVGTKVRSEYVMDDMGNVLDENGMVYEDSYTQKPSFVTVEDPVYEDVVLEDRPTFDVYPNQYVHVSPEYVYSLQDKRYVIFETEKTLDELKEDAPLCGYFNLHLLEKIEGNTADHAEKTYNKGGKKDIPPEPVSPPFVVFERWGLFPANVERDMSGKIISAKPGINKQGEIDDKAENIECILSYVELPGMGKTDQSSAKLYEMIRFQASPHTKRPMVRFNCYIDALNDEGFGDGEVTRELQIATNDMYNLSNYRTKLATTPAFKGKRFSGIPSKITISPETVIELEDMTDLQEVLIKDDIQGAMIHLGTLSSRMDYVMATSPMTMGMAPENRETATVGSIMDQRASIRIGMKSMTLEKVGFTEFYDMLLTLCGDFMLPQTLKKILGEDAQFFNPEREDRFKPVSQAIQTEESKKFKIKMWDQLLGRLVAFPNPKTPLVINYIMGQVLELMGGDFKHFKKFMFEEDIKSNFLYALATGQGRGMLQGGTPNMPGGPNPQSNQAGLPMMGQEMGARKMLEGAA
uniref:Portal protein n=1 Tax=viral metagenome TaxID=1070528 RepID=A0A6H1ZN18_9ZZZZ